MSKKENFFRKVFSFFALLLCLLCLQKARAGILLYEGERAVEKNDYGNAIDFLSKIQNSGLKNSRVLYLLGQSLYEKGVRENDKAALGKSLSYFEKLTSWLPYYGRAWLYRGMAGLALEEQLPGGLRRERWKILRSFFERADRQEPGSSWIHVMVGTRLLSGTSFLSVQEKKSAVESIKKGLSIHYPHQASFYLEAVLASLWKQFSDFEILLQVTPRDAFSYQHLIYWMDRNNLWANHEKVDGEFLNQRQKEERELCLRGEELLKKDNRRNAYVFFQRAFWLHFASLRARAGMLVSRPDHKMLSQEHEVWLRDILEQGREEIEFYLSYLKGLEGGIHHPYVRGLLAYRTGNNQDALSWFKKTQDHKTYPLLPLYKAKALMKLRRKHQAIEALLPALEQENPDLRILFYLKKLKGADKLLLRSKIERTKTSYYESARWWRVGSGFANSLEDNARIGLPLNLKPGQVRIHFTARTKGSAAGYGSYIQVRLWNQNTESRLGAIYLASSKWREMVFDIQTSGGIRWLEVGHSNGRQRPGQPAPVLEVGELTLEFIE